MVVLKFGGTSVGTAQALRRVTAIVSRERRPRVVVVSALAGVTDALLAMAGQIEAGRGDAALRAVDDLRGRHAEAASAVRGAGARAAVLAEIDRDIDVLRALLRALSVPQEVPPRALDAIAATGELLSSRLAAAALASAGIPSRWLDARQALVTNDDHTRAAPLWDRTAQRLVELAGPELATGCVPVIGGFVGATPGGVTTTLGRGGSDYTAAIVAACLDAGELQIWSDVDGVLSADPRLVGEARPVSRLSFAEASELASFGARVLHPATVQPAIARGIPVRVRNSRRPQGEGTLILPGCPDRDTLLAGLACRHPVTVIEAGTRHHGPFRGLLGRVIEAAERSGASLALVTTSGTAVTLVVDQTAPAAALAGTLAGFADVTVRRDRALLCAVGDGVAARAAFTAELLSAIAPAVVELVTHAAGGRGVIAIVAAREAAAAMARAHGCFLEAPRAALAS